MVKPLQTMSQVAKRIIGYSCSFNIKIQKKSILPSYFKTIYMLSADSITYLGTMKKINKKIQQSTSNITSHIHHKVQLSPIIIQFYHVCLSEHAFICFCVSPLIIRYLMPIKSVFITGYNYFLLHFSSVYSDV